MPRSQGLQNNDDKAQICAGAMSLLTKIQMSSRQPSGEQTYWRRVMAAMSPARFGIVVAITLVASAQILAQPMEADFWSVFDIAYAWMLYTLEVLFIASCIAVAYTLADEALPQTGVLRWLVLIAALMVASLAATYIAFAFMTFGGPPALDEIARQSLRWSSIGAMVAAVDAIRRRALRARAEIRVRSTPARSWRAKRPHSSCNCCSEDRTALPLQHACQRSFPVQDGT